MRSLAVTLALLLATLLCSQEARADVDLWPLLELSDESTTVLYPLFVHEGDFMMVFPLYYRTNEARDHHFVWPLVKVSDRRLTRVAPVWFSNQDEFTLFPIVRQTPEYSLLMLPPIYLRKDGEFQAVFPLFAKSKHKLFALPSFYHSAEPNEPHVDVLWPLFRREVDAQRRTSSVLGRLFRLERTDTGTDTQRELTLGYLFHTERKAADRWWTMLAPMLSFYQQGAETGAYVFPYYQKRGPELRTTGLLPLFEVHRKGATQSFWMFPYYQSRSPERSRTIVFPLFFHSHRIDGRTSERTTRQQILWPIYSRHEVRAADGSLLERYRRFAIFSDQKTRSGSRTFRVLGMPIVERMQ